MHRQRGVPVGFRLPPGDVERLDWLAQATQRTRTSVLRALVALATTQGNGLQLVQREVAHQEGCCAHAT